jgi:hypothetical protein
MDFDMAFELPPVTIGERDGDRITSCTVAWRTVKETQADPAELSPALTKFKAAIVAALPEGVEKFKWAMVKEKLLTAWTERDSKPKSQERTLARLRTRLVSSGHLEKGDDNQWLLTGVDNDDTEDNEVGL